MKLQYFLRGLGVGIVLTAIVLCISYRVNGNQGVDVVEEAKKLGMVFPEGTQAPERTKEPEISQTATPAAITEPEDSAEPEKNVISSGAGVTGEAEDKTEDKKTAKPKSTAKPTAKPTKEPAKENTSSSKSGKKFTVRSGLLSSSVAREMREAGIIKDADAFDEYMEKSGYGRKIRSGTYYIPSGASYSEIAKIITRQ